MIKIILRYIIIAGTMAFGIYLYNQMGVARMDKSQECTDNDLSIDNNLKADNDMKADNKLKEDNKLKTNKVTPNIKKVALTFDDGPNGIYTEKLLDGLLERNVKATFFITGENIKENEDLIARMYEEGHLLGNHTYSHVNLSELDFEAACEEINDTNASVYNITGYEMEYIRPPFGEWTDKLKEKTDMAIVMWNVDPLDWKDQNSALVTSRILKNVKNGDIILLHDIFNSSVEAALQVIDELKKQGYIFVTVDELRESEKVMIN